MPDDKADEKFHAGKPKIRPRDVDKIRKPEAEEGEGEDSASQDKVGPLPKRSDPEWLAKLAPAEPARPRRRRREAWEADADQERDTAGVESTRPSEFGEDGASHEAGPAFPAEQNRGEGAGSENNLPGSDEEEEPAEGSEGGADELEPWGDSTPRKRKVRRRKKEAAAGVFKRLFLKGLAWALALSAGWGALFLVFSAGRHLGREEGFQEGRAAAVAEREAIEEKRVRVLPAEEAGRLDAALREVREGDAAKALQEIQGLIGRFPDVPSLRYLGALAASQAGEFEEAERLALASIARGERVSDSKVLLSAVEAQKGAMPGYEAMGDPRLRAKKLLEEAIAADPANPGARLEMGSLLRYLGDRDGAIREIRAAKMRLHPIDNQLAADVTVALIEVEELPPGTVEPFEPQSDDVRVLFPAAYTALRAGNKELGLRILNRCKAILQPDLFLYLINDPAFRKFAYMEEIKRLCGDVP